MRYTEKEIEQIESLSDYVKRFLQLIFTSQFRLISEITRKLIFIKKEQLEKLLFTTGLIASSMILLQGIIASVFGTFNMFYGTLPLMFQVGVVVIIFIAYAMFKKSSFNLYNHVMQMTESLQQKDSQKKEDVPVSIKKEPVQETPVTLEKSQFASYDSSYDEGDCGVYEDDLSSQTQTDDSWSEFADLQGLYDTTMFDFDSNHTDSDYGITMNGLEPLREDLIDPDVFECEDIIAYKKQNEIKINNLGDVKAPAFTQEELDEIDRELEMSINNATYIDEGTIDLILEKFKADEALEASDMFNQFSMPTSFRMIV